jgi:hypothetical protein
MTEEFLHYIWKFRLLNRELFSRSGEPVTVIHPGEHNQDGGPDFLNTRIRLGDTTWAGNVEIHIDEGDWYRHNHHLDKAYENVILHVVFEDDPDFSHRVDNNLPVLVIKDQFPGYIHERYEDFLRNRLWIPCELLIHSVDSIYFEQWSYALLTERLVNRTGNWERMLGSNKFDWAETLYQCVASAFGLRINTLPFELLAKALPLKLILKYKNNRFSLEALAFGQSGMLNTNFSEEYPAGLKKEYEFLAAKYSLQPMDPSLWKFLRLRPSSFPTIRIAQWAAFLQQADRLFSCVLDCKAAEDVTELFSLQASEYWETHFVFDKLSPVKPKILGAATIHLLILNAVAPFLFFYGDYKGISQEKERAITLIETIPGEKNTMITRWQQLGLPVDNAMYTQALIHLKSTYCDKKKCLECRIGNRLLVDGDAG